MTPSTPDLNKLLAEATAGPWRIGSWGDNVFGTGPKDEWLPICRVKRDDAPLEESMDAKDARLIALAPTLAAEVLALRAERDAFREAANRHRDEVQRLSLDVIPTLRARDEAAQKLAEALAFYADLSHEGPWHLPSEDYGKRARAALSAYEATRKMQPTEYEIKLAQLKKDFPNGI